MTKGPMNTVERAYARLRAIRCEHFNSYSDEGPSEIESELAALREEIRTVAEQCVFDASLGVETRAAAVMNLAESHYDLACTLLERSSPAFQRRVDGGYRTRGYSLDLDVYVPHWLWSHGDRLPQEVMALVSKNYYEPKPSPYLAKGESNYHEPIGEVR